MNRGDGQRQRDSHDSWAPFVVRPAYRRDPDDHAQRIDLIVCAVALLIIAIVVVAVHAAMPTIK